MTGAPVPAGWDQGDGAHGKIHRDGRRNENANGFRGGSYVNGEPGFRQSIGNVPGTGTRSLRNYEPAPLEVWVMATQPFGEAHFATFPPELAKRCLVAAGAGTTGLVADRLRLDCTLIEINPAYAEMARRRIESDAGFFAAVSDAAGLRPAGPMPGTLPL